MSKQDPYFMCVRCESHNTQRDTENYYRCLDCGCQFEVIETKPFPVLREIKPAQGKSGI
jgi:hypothetical protein